jgi:phosphotransferase system enzyme I (PtsI)
MTQTILRGIGVSPGRAQGRAVVLAGSAVTVPSTRPCTDCEHELRRLESAVSRVSSDLRRRAGAATGTAAEILAATALMAADPALLEKAREAISGRRRRADRAMWEAIGEFAEGLAAAGDYFAQRVQDLHDIRDRLVADLSGTARRVVPILGEPAILVSVDLAPADTAALDTRQVLAFVTAEGGPTSHTAILARSLGIPAVVACAGLEQVSTGTAVLLDGETGEVHLGAARPGSSPPGHAAAARPRAAGRLSYGGSLADGEPAALYANVGEPRGVDTALAAGAPGVGLLRTEFLFDDRLEPPPEHEQARIYAAVFRSFPRGRVVIRTLDAGADKKLPFLAGDAEPNPALGVRGLRIGQRDPALLDLQLAAIARARQEPGAKVWTMAPMVATAQEARWFASLAREHGLGPVGVMIEIPAAAIHAERIMTEVDFVSIGTNDLAQYAFAADRMSGTLAGLNDPWQPALLELIWTVGAAGRRLGKPVGVCGEAAADPLLAPVLIGLGASSLSMTPRALPAVGDRIAGLSLPRCGHLAELALSAGTPHEGRLAVRTALAQR